MALTNDCFLAGSVKNGSFATFHSPAAMLLINSHLSSRGWIVQEKILSPRLLNSATDGISWSCLHGDAMEIERDGTSKKLPRRAAVADFYDQRPLRKIFGDIVRHVDWTVGSIYDARHCNLHELERYTKDCPLDDKLFLERFHRYWKQVVAMYSYCDLTGLDDKLVALGAIPQRLQMASGYTYLAGLWFQKLITNLIWSISAAPWKRGRLIYQSKYRALSWSWASVEGSILFSVYPDNELRTEHIAHFQFGDCNTHSLDTSKTGKVFDAQLHFSINLRRWTTGFEEYFNDPHSLLLDEIGVGSLKPDERKLDLLDPRLEELCSCSLRKFAPRYSKEDKPMKTKGFAVVPYPRGPTNYERLGTFILRSHILLQRRSLLNILFRTLCFPE